MGHWSKDLDCTQPKKITRKKWGTKRVIIQEYVQVWTRCLSPFYQQPPSGHRLGIHKQGMGPLGAFVLKAVHFPLSTFFFCLSQNGMWQMAKFWMRSTHGWSASQANIVSEETWRLCSTAPIGRARRASANFIRMMSSTFSYKALQCKRELFVLHKNLCMYFEYGQVILLLFVKLKMSL